MLCDSKGAIFMRLTSMTSLLISGSGFKRFPLLVGKGMTRSHFGVSVLLALLEFARC